MVKDKEEPRNTGTVENEERGDCEGEIEVKMNQLWNAESNVPVNVGMKLLCGRIEL